MSRKTAGSDMKEAFKRLKVNQPFALPKDGPGLMAPQAIQMEAPPKEAPQNLSHSQAKAPPSEVSLIESPKSEEPKYEPPQTEQPLKKAPDFELPTKEGAGNSSGFFKLSHAVFSHPKLRGLPGDGFRLFLWLSSKAWRFPQSEGLVRASVTYIESHTGMSHANISRSLKTLKELGLVSLEETDFKRGNLWRISALANGNPEPKKSNKLEMAQIEVPQSDSEGASVSGTSCLKMSKQRPQKEAQIRSIKNKNNYLKEFSVMGIMDPKLSDSEETRINREVAVAKFENSLPPDERTAFISNYIQQEFGHGFMPPARVLKGMAAVEWLRSHKETQIAI